MASEEQTVLTAYLTTAAETGWKEKHVCTIGLRPLTAQRMPAEDDSLTEEMKRQLSALADALLIVSILQRHDVTDALALRKLVHHLT